MRDVLNKIVYRKIKVKHVLLFLLLILLLLLLLTRCGAKQETASGGSGVSFDPNAGEYQPEETEAPAPGVTIPGWVSLSLPANETEVSVNFYNPEENEGLYYLTFELRLPDDSEQGYEVLYTSGLVKPGLYIQHITLSRPLEAGSYNAIIHVQPYRIDDDLTPTNNADLETTLVVS